MVTTSIRNSPSGPLVDLENENSGGRSVLEYLTGSRTLLEAINAAFADTDIEATEIYFPPGSYPISGAAVSTVANKVIRFVPGSVLVIAQGGSFNFSGRNTTVLAPVVRFNTVVTGAPFIMSGEDGLLVQPRFENNADNGGLTCLRVEGEGTTVQQISIYSEAKNLQYGIVLETTAGAHVKYVLIDGVYIDLGDPTVADGDKTYTAMIYMHCQYCTVRDYTHGSLGGRNLFPTGVIIVEGQKNVLENIWMFLMFGATYALVLRTNSEFLEILGSIFTGRNSGTYVANSVGILCEGNFAGGHLKMFNTVITGFNVGMRFQGGTDTATFIGVSIANNNTYGIEIDTAATGGFANSAWTFTGCYLGDVTQLRSIHFISGLVAGMQFTACQIGIADGQIGFVAEDACTVGGVVFSGCRLIGASGGANEFVFQPGALTSTVLFINNALHAISGYGTGAFANVCMDIFDPTFVGLTVGPATNLGGVSRRITSIFNSIFTANFGNIGAGATVSLNFTFTGTPTNTTAQLVATMGSALGAFASAGIDFQWWINNFNQISASARNSTGAPINSVTGGVRFGITVFVGGS